MIVSDELYRPVQRRVSSLSYAACDWLIHAERLIHKLVGFNESQRRAIERTRARVWRFYAALKTYCRDPTPRRKAALDERFERGVAP